MRNRDLRAGPAVRVLFEGDRAGAGGRDFGGAYLGVGGAGGSIVCRADGWGWPAKEGDLG